MSPRYEQVVLSLPIITVERPAGTALPLAEVQAAEAALRAEVAELLPVEDQGDALTVHLLPLTGASLGALRTFAAYLTAPPRHLHAPEVRAFLDGFFEAEKR